MAATTNDVHRFTRRQKVVAVTELPGVPVGTEGVVYYEAGLRWFRYHVAFGNGMELANVDAGALIALDEWKQRQHDTRRAELEAQREARQAEALTTVRAPGGH